MDIRHRALFSFAPLLLLAISLAFVVPWVNGRTAENSAQQLHLLNDLVTAQDIEILVLRQRESVGRTVRGFAIAIYTTDYSDQRQMTLSLIEQQLRREDKAEQHFSLSLASLYGDLDAQHRTIIAAVERGELAAATSLFYGKSEQLTYTLLATAQAAQGGARRKLGELEANRDTLHRRTFVGLGIGVGGSVVFALLLAWLLILDVLRPIERLAADAARYAQGDGSGELGYVTNVKQVAHLRASFQHLLGVTLARQERLAEQVAREQHLRETVEGLNADLARAKDELEQRVAERTGELRRANDRLGVELAERERTDAALRESEERLRQLNEELEHRVAQRTQELEAIQQELVNTARRAGMAEIATNVLHNIGNVLNSVNVSAKLAMERVRGAKLAGLPRAAALLSEHQRDPGEFLTRDEQGRHLVSYLRTVSQSLLADQEETLRDLDKLLKSVGHIKDIVRTQQAYAGARSVVEEVPVTELLEDALRMNDLAVMRPRLRIVREFAEIGPISLDKHRVLSILVNLISNAKYATDELPGDAAALTLRVEKRGRTGVRISVSDNGMGITPENLTRIFAHGFTTRKAGHGFGLHSAALSAREMNGALSVQSEGAGKGATFTLDLPGRSAEPARRTED